MGRMLPFLLAVSALAGCTDRTSPPKGDAFSADGETIAMSGAEGGARYACVTCHGLAGEGNGYDVPRLSGLPAGYLQKQMQDYALGLRPHAVMHDLAAFLSADQRVAVANYYASLPEKASAPTVVDPADPIAVSLYANGDPDRGVVACMQCHGADGVGSPKGPPLAGQPSLYLAQQLVDWRAGKRRNDGTNEMTLAVQRLTDDEIEALSRYLDHSPARPPSPDR